MRNHTELLIAFLSKAMREGHVTFVNSAKITAKTAGPLEYDKKIEIKFTVYPGTLSAEGAELEALMDHASESSIEQHKKA